MADKKTTKSTKAASAKKSSDAKAFFSSVRKASDDYGIKDYMIIVDGGKFSCKGELTNIIGDLISDPKDVPVPLKDSPAYTFRKLLAKIRTIPRSDYGIVDLGVCQGLPAGIQIYSHYVQMNILRGDMPIAAIVFDNDVQKAKISAVDKNGYTDYNVYEAVPYDDDIKDIDWEGFTDDDCDFIKAMISRIFNYDL